MTTGIKEAFTLIKVARTCVPLFLLVSCLFIFGIESVSAAPNKPDVWDGGNEPFGGEGTQEKPYIIDTAKKLAYLAIQVNSGNKYKVKFFQLDRDIDLAKKQWTPIGDTTKKGTAFEGVFNGEGHTISNLTVNMPDANGVGLFGAIGNGVVRQLKIANVEIVGKSEAGGLAGISWGVTFKVTVSGGSVTADENSGGLIGTTIGRLSETRVIGSTSNCEADVSVKGKVNVGGLIGKTSVHTVSESKATGNVNGYEIVGGLIGQCYMASVFNSTATGNVEGENGVGGLIGFNNSNAGEADKDVLLNSTAAGNVKGKDSVGGLIGYNNGVVTVTDCKATGKVTGDSNVGEFFGNNVGSGKIIFSATPDTGNKVSGKLADVAREGIRLALLYGTDQKALEKELANPLKVDNFQGIMILTFNHKGIKIELGVLSRVIDFLYFIPNDSSYGVSNDGIFATVAQVARETLKSQGVEYDGADKGLRFNISGHTLDIMGDDRGVMLLSNMTMNSGVVIHAYN